MEFPYFEIPPGYPVIAITPNGVRTCQYIGTDGQTYIWQYTAANARVAIREVGYFAANKRLANFDWSDAERITLEMRNVELATDSQEALPHQEW